MIKRCNLFLAHFPIFYIVKDAAARACDLAEIFVPVEHFALFLESLRF